MFSLGPISDSFVCTENSLIMSISCTDLRAKESLRGLFCDSCKVCCLRDKSARVFYLSSALLASSSTLVLTLLSTSDNLLSSFWKYTVFSFSMSVYSLNKFWAFSSSAAKSLFSCFRRSISPFTAFLGSLCLAWDVDAGFSRKGRLAQIGWAPPPRAPMVKSVINVVPLTGSS